MSRLERWSRLKRNVPQEVDTPSTPLSATAPVDEPPAEQNATYNINTEQAQTAPDEAQALPEPEPGSLDHTLPDPDTLEAGSDFSAYMAAGVSGPLRRQALKRLWATGNYNVRDGLDDYDADYNKLLKPMTSELASKLRRWTHKVEEIVDKQLDDTQSEPQSLNDKEVNVHTEEASAAVEEGSAAPCTTSGNVVQNASLDDQSDYVYDTNTKI